MTADDRAVTLAAEFWQRHSPEGVQAAFHERIANRDGGSSPLRTIRGLDAAGHIVTLVDVTEREDA